MAHTNTSSSILSNYLQSSIGKKQVMAVTGALLCGFLISHLLGNFLMFVGAEEFNMYAYRLTSTPLIYIAEAILAVIFLAHLGCAAKLFVQNMQARPVSYHSKKNTGRGTTFASSTMPYTGMIILIFLVLHLLHFKFGPVYVISYEELEVRDLYRTVIEYFASPLNVAWYVFAMLALSFHLLHGVQSIFQTFGFRHPGYRSVIKLGSTAFAVLIPLGYALLSIWCHFQSTNY